MEPVQDLSRVQRMFARGEPFLVDPASGYKYALVARCPRDGSFSAVAQIEKAGPALSRVTFQCPACATLFAPKPEDMLVW